MSFTYKMDAQQAMRAPTMSLLGQKKWWRSNDGSVKRRRDLDINHKVNLMAWLVRNAGSIVDEQYMNPIYALAPDEVLDELEGLRSAPERWVMSTPMWQALLKDVLKFTGSGPEAFGLRRMGGASLVGLSENVFTFGIAEGLKREGATEVWVLPSE